MHRNLWASAWPRLSGSVYFDVLQLTRYFAGEIFSYPVRRTWEFTNEHPIRSVFPLWPVYGLPMLLLRWLWVGNGQDGEIPPIVVFWTLRVLMFLTSFVLEDWAIHELIPSPRHRRIAVLLVASSYVTWTYQTHTFSNSIETLVVAWSLVLIQRIVESKVCQTGRLHHRCARLTRFPLAATVFARFHDSRHRGYIRCLQPYYLSSIFINSRPSFDTPFPQQVSKAYRLTLRCSRKLTVVDPFPSWPWLWLRLPLH